MEKTILSNKICEWEVGWYVGNGRPESSLYVHKIFQDACGLCICVLYVTVCQPLAHHAIKWPESGAVFNRRNLRLLIFLSK